MRVLSLNSWKTLRRAVPVVLTMGLWTGIVSADGTVRSTAPSVAKDAHGHEHPEKGPHNGDLIELGKEEYHAEIVHGEEGKITIYLLDHSAKNAVATDAKSVTINLVHEGKVEQYKLPAVPEKGDPAGKTSRFILTNKHLTEDLDSKGSVAKLVISINGRQYTSQIAHNHEHTNQK